MNELTFITDRVSVTLFRKGHYQIDDLITKQPLYSGFLNHQLSFSIAYKELKELVKRLVLSHETVIAKQKSVRRSNLSWRDLSLWRDNVSGYALASEDE